MGPLLEAEQVCSPEFPHWPLAGFIVHTALNLPQFLHFFNQLGLAPPAHFPLTSRLLRLTALPRTGLFSLPNGKRYFYVRLSTMTHMVPSPPPLFPLYFLSTSTLCECLNTLQIISFWLRLSPWLIMVRTVKESLLLVGRCKFEARYNKFEFRGRLSYPDCETVTRFCVEKLRSFELMT